MAKFLCYLLRVVQAKQATKQGEVEGRDRERSHNNSLGDSNTSESESESESDTSTSDSSQEVQGVEGGQGGRVATRQQSSYPAYRDTFRLFP
jgi:hypothetical protein